MKPKFHISGFIFSKFLSGQQSLHLKIASFYRGGLNLVFEPSKKARLWKQTNWVGNHDVLNISQVKPWFHDSKTVRLQTSEMHIWENLNVLEALFYDHKNVDWSLKICEGLNWPVRNIWPAPLWSAHAIFFLSISQLASSTINPFFTVTGRIWHD